MKYFITKLYKDINLGVSLQYLGDFKTAVMCYDKALNLNPTHADSYINKGTKRIYILGNSLHILKRYAEAVI